MGAGDAVVGAERGTGRVVFFGEMGKAGPVEFFGGGAEEFRCFVV